MKIIFFYFKFLIKLPRWSLRSLRNSSYNFLKRNFGAAFGFRPVNTASDQAARMTGAEAVDGWRLLANLINNLID